MLPFPVGMMKTASSGAWTGPSSGLTHRWAMNTAGVVGTTVTDSVGSLNGTRTGDAAVNGGGTAIAFAGAGAVTLASSPFANLTSAHSTFLWVKMTDYTQLGGGGSSQTFFCVFVDGNNTIRLSNNGGSGLITITFFRAGVDITNGTASAQLADASDHHVGWKYDGSTITSIWVDGVSKSLSAPSTLTQPSSNIIGSRETNFTGGMTGEIHGLVTYSNDSVDATLVYAAG